MPSDRLVPPGGNAFRQAGAPWELASPFIPHTMSTKCFILVIVSILLYYTIKHGAFKANSSQSATRQNEASHYHHAPRPAFYHIVGNAVIMHRANRLYSCAIYMRHFQEARRQVTYLWGWFGLKYFMQFTLCPCTNVDDAVAIKQSDGCGFLCTSCLTKSELGGGGGTRTPCDEVQPLATDSVRMSNSVK